MSAKLLRFLPRFFRGNKDKDKISTTNKFCNYVEAGTKPGDYICRILLLDDKEVNLAVKPSAKGSSLIRKVFDHVNLLERDYFGLRYLDQNNQPHWLDPIKSVSSQLKGGTAFTLYFVVKFYAADPCKLREEITRYYFFLQVKKDIYDGRLPVSFEEIIELAAYILQSELGDYNPKLHTEGYVSEFRFIQHQTIEHEQAIAVLHRRLAGQVPAVAEYRFLDKAKWLEMYGVDLHPVKGEGNMEYMLGITPTGIVLHKNKNKVGNYFWPRITKVRFKDRIFSIKVKDRNNDEHWYAFESPNKVTCKHLWKCCAEHHAFFSARTERMIKENQQSRDQPEVNRVASKKHQRRSHSDPKISVSCYGDQASKGTLSMTISPESVRMPRLRSLPELPSKDSPRSTRSYPWESSSAGGLYTSGKDSPMSTKSDKLKFQVQRRAISGSDSESSYKRRYTTNKRGSDNESEQSVSRRRRKEITSNSDSDVSCRRPPLYPSRGGLSSGDNSRPSTLREDAVSPIHSTAPGAEGVQKRRRRRRSKSPNKGPPEELKNHFVYNLVETDDWSEDQLKEIPYTKVETKCQPYRIKHSPKSKHYSKTRGRSGGYHETEVVQHSSTVRQDSSTVGKSARESTPGRDTDGNQEDGRPKSQTDETGVNRTSYCSESGPTAAESDTPVHRSSRQSYGHSDSDAGHTPRHYRSSWQSCAVADSPNAGSYTPARVARRSYAHHDDSDYGSYTPVHRSRQSHSRGERSDHSSDYHTPSHRSRHGEGRSGSSHSHRSRHSSHGDRESHSSRSRHSRCHDENDPGRSKPNRDPNLTVVFHEGQTNEMATEL
ncbi:FERM domain-containing protein 3,Band 4.1-like protein 5,Band 4.1-like protein 3,Band 4.1-like protein 4B,Tyrosine-protein phosphatase non-receptor type 4,Band 4.1-like protein 1,Band 4.1-like protein 2,FERM domain-containing protein 5,Protein 4.1 [Acanthosepion pharaonis]|uniref:FERM domain-containing protein n=1 Tax=Acanthosepion pharaonis TaxID=158019 RepID=A0A812EEZ6_ACAPH|nr:FERM domain-containing protein 3,Band 4.1-like protein 5,Band 4.1-like protein 3,Band 4.1-like protein 4B,Tyrosine-protein phosphatase non-receptor type 4,Band 4.1-like protein 1,Band 4.1-like protein 2,FERM domain-containing protein 5,Protein 4.1 [Sepia pharaonis]